jgi:hypothetical protein
LAHNIPQKLPARGEIMIENKAARIALTIEFTSIKGKYTGHLYS